MGSIGGGSSSSDSRQAQESGGPLFTPGSRLRYETSLPVAAAYTQGLPLAQSLAGKTTSYALPELTSSGLYGEQQNAFTEAIKQAMSRVSGNFAQPIRIKPASRNVVLENCRNCHQPLIDASHLAQGGLVERDCTHCHQQTGHRN